MQHLLVISSGVAASPASGTAVYRALLGTWYGTALVVPFVNVTANGTECNYVSE